MSAVAKFGATIVSNLLSKVNELAATDAAVSGNENEFTEIHANFVLPVYFITCRH